MFTTGSHGMYVLSLIGGNKPGIFIGTSPKASFWLLRTEDADTENIIEEDNWVAGAEFADSVGADIISSSLGYTVFDDSLQNHTYSQMNGHTARASIGANIAASKGILVVNSAGNSAQKPFKHIGAPADADSVLAVGAIDFNGVHAKFSSIGPSADGRIKPDISAPGVEDAIIGLNDSITFGSGTSFAGPLISGLSACLWQSRPDLSNMQLMNIIKKSADKYYNPDELYGYGVPNFTVALMNLQSSTDEKKISLYPNPFKEKLNVIFYNSEDSQKVNIEVYSLNSIKLYSLEKLSVKGYNYLSLNNLNTLQSGFYILRIITEDQVFTAKLIKQ